MKKIVCVLSLIIGLSSALSAQIYVDDQGNVTDQRKKIITPVTRSTVKESNSGFVFDKSKLVLGGNFGVQFGDYTVVNVSPQVGYNFSKYFTAGMGIGYTYMKEKEQNGYKFTSSYVGMNIFGRFYPIENIVLSVQPEGNRMWKSVKNTYTGQKASKNEFIGSVLVGGGIRFQNIIAMIQYDVVQDKDSSYGDNIFYSVGYSFNF